MITLAFQPAHPMSETQPDAIRAYYRTLFSAWGRQHWWPAQSRFEVIVGAYLTQNTSWTNVEKALGNLRRARLLTITAEFGARLRLSWSNASGQRGTSGKKRSG